MKIYRNNLHDKLFVSAALVLILTIIGTEIINATAVSEGKKQNWRISVYNMATEVPVEDTLKVELLKPDSTLIFSQMLRVYYFLPGSTFNNAGFNLEGQDFLVRLSHPDYETVIHKVHITKDRDHFNLPIRRLTLREKERMLDEVVVTASKVQFVYKGDTLQYNADAFELAEGSMLEALIRRLPGAELRENGQIFVNGRFVNKLLLDGKDFFRNDKLVLLQNLPAYTVKNIQVYEENSREQLIKKGSNDPDLVMNVSLKKEFNAGWLANAEAGGGTHNRYRLRGFGMLYNSKSRYAVYGLANNLNETGSPDMSGQWKSKSNLTDEIITRGGGLDYHLEAGNKIAIQGSATAQYQTVFSNSLTNQQNYIPQGINYNRRWNDRKSSNLQVHAENITQFKSGWKGWTPEIQSYFDYGSNKARSRVTEGSFATIPGDYPDLRKMLQTGMPDTLNLLNRYLADMNSKGKNAYGQLKLYNSLRFGKHLLSLTLCGDLSHRWHDGDQSYLLQYSGEEDTRTLRSNPQNSHGYSYALQLSPWLYFGKWSLMGYYTVKKSYEYSNTMFYDMADYADAASIRDPLQQWQRLEQLQRVLDAQNSYYYGLHTLSQNINVDLAYTKKEIAMDGTRTGQFQISFTPDITCLRRKMDFKGWNTQTVKRDTWLPGTSIRMSWLKNNKWYATFIYELKSRAPLMTDMLDIRFNSDPMNPTIGNPDLKYELSHHFEMSYNSAHYFFNKLSVFASAKYNLYQNRIVYGTIYDVATGIRTTKPQNVNGNRDGEFYLFMQLFPENTRRLSVLNSLTYAPARFMTLVSTADETGMKLSKSHSNAWVEDFVINYSTKRFLVSLGMEYTNCRTISLTGDFQDYTVQSLKPRFRGRLTLPSNWEITTNLSYIKHYGFTESSLNDGELLWNARISKSFRGGSLLLAIDGYDILQRYKTIKYDVTSAYRRETRFNSVPSYFMFTVKYFFAKKPR